MSSPFSPFLWTANRGGVVTWLLACTAAAVKFNLLPATAHNYPARRALRIKMLKEKYRGVFVKGRIPPDYKFWRL